MKELRLSCRRAHYIPLLSLFLLPTVASNNLLALTKNRRNERFRETKQHLDHTQLGHSFDGSVGAE